MTYLTGYNSRIISKIYLNKLGKAQNSYNFMMLNQGQINIKVKKYNKELFDFYELNTLLEQTFMQKPVIKFSEIIERATNVKIRDLFINIILNKKGLENFYTFFIFYILSDRKKRNLIEYNNINLNKGEIYFKLKDLKLFRRILWNNVMNIDNEIEIIFGFNSNNTILSQYRLYSLLKMLLKLIKKKEYAKK